MTKHAQRREHKSTRKIRHLVLVSIIVAVFALGAMAAVSLRDSKAKSSAPQPSGDQTGDARANLHSRTGSQLPLSPQTGQVRPLTQEEAQRLAAELKQLINQSTDGLQSVHRADGSVSMDLEGRFQSVAVAKRDGNGNVVQSCVDNREAAAAFFGIDPKLLGVTSRTVSAKTSATATEKGGDR